jgi:hypothetical protein
VYHHYIDLKIAAGVVMSLKDLIPHTPDDLFTNTVNNTIDFDDTGALQADMAALLAQLAERNIKPGAYIGSGNMGIAYQLETLDGQTIDSAIIRIDPAGIIGKSDNPLAIEQVFQERSNDFAATIVPRASEKEFTAEELSTTLASFNASGELDKLTDLTKGQFMAVEGINAPVLADISSLLPEGLKNWGGTVDNFCTSKDINLDSEAVRVNCLRPEAYMELKTQKEAVGDKVRAELSAKGIDIESVPSKSNVNTLDQAIDDPHKGAQKG